MSVGFADGQKNRYPSGNHQIEPEEITAFPRLAGSHRSEARHEDHLWQRHCQAT